MRPRDRGLFLTKRGQRAQSRRFRSLRFQDVRRMLAALDPKGEAEVLIRHAADHIFCELED